MAVLDMAHELFDWKSIEKSTSTGRTKGRTQRAPRRSKLVRKTAAAGVLTIQALEERGKSAASARVRADPKRTAGICLSHPP